MKTVWLVLDKGNKALKKPYSRQHLIFDKDEDMETYIKGAGWAGTEIAALMRDTGMMNFYQHESVDLKVVKLEVK